MTLNLVTKIEELKNILRPVLDSRGPIILDAIKAQLKSAKPKKTRGVRLGIPWEYQIHPEDPLKFKECEVNGYRLQVDLFCHLKGNNEDWPPTLHQEFVIRVWSLDNRLSFRESIDATELKETLEKRSPQWGRVILRYHFDLAGSTQYAPIYHLQIGGTPHGSEMCMILTEVDVPRLPYPPLDLVLACELILANFFREKYTKISQKTEWRNIVHESQDLCLRPYFDFAIRSCNKDEITVHQALCGGR